jgi:hypothetical protein
MKRPQPLKATDQLTVAEFADLLGFPLDSVLTVLERNRQAIRQPFYSIAQLSIRWQCSRNTVSAVLRDAEAKLMNLSNGNGKHGRWGIPASAVEHIEKSRMETLPEAKAAYGKAA